MAGGRWEAENKIRPGAYINFESVAAPLSNVGTRGIMTMPVPLSWGKSGEMIPVYSTDLLNGKSIPKIGLTAFDPESLIFREALSSAYLALVYRMDTGGKKAIATLGDLEVSAKYNGTFGNNISVAIIKSDTVFDVVTYLSGAEKDRQTVPADGTGLLPNDWVDFSLSEGKLITVQVGLALEDGANGTIVPADYTKYFSAAEQSIWNTMAFPDITPAVKTQAVTFIKNRRDKSGRKCQVVLVDQNTANYEGVISVDQGYVNSADEKVEPAIFTATIAGLTAAAAINQSNTFRLLENAISVIKPIADEDVEAALLAGKLLLTRRQDGGIVIEQDINTLHQFTPKKDYSFSKNRVIRVLDDVGNQVLIKFENSYIGKVDNDGSGRSVFRADFISYMTKLQNMVAIKNFDPQNDVKVSQGMAIDGIVAELWIQPVDSMEKLYLRVYVGGEA